MPETNRNRLPSRATAINYAKAIDGKTTEYRIEGHKGLVLLCQPTGTAAFYMVYSVYQGGRYRTKRHKLGGRGDIMLSQAIAELERLRSMVRNGLDPQREATNKRQSLSFTEVFEQRLKRKPVNANTENEYRKVYRHYIEPYIGGMPVVDITKSDVWNVMDAADDKGVTTTKRMAHTVMKGVFEFAIDRDYIESSPMDRIKSGVKETPRERVLSLDEIALIWREIDERLSRQAMILSTAYCLKAIILTGQRRSEVVMASREEFEGGLWSIPGSRTKNGKPHKLPLATQAHRVFTDAMNATETPHIFPARHFGSVKHLSPNSLSKTFLRLTQKVGVENARLHDCRRSMATHMGELGIDAGVIERILNHSPEGITRQHYDHSKMLPQIKEAFEAWERELQRLLTYDYLKR